MYEGACNQCGACCCKNEVAPNGFLVAFRCIFLLQADKVGKPGATVCAAYAHRYDGLPITMVSVDGRYSYPSKCLASYPRPTDAIPPECSYRFVGEGATPKWNVLYAPELLCATKTQATQSKS